jgi:hypothetical protein
MVSVGVMAGVGGSEKLEMGKKTELWTQTD